MADVPLTDPDRNGIPTAFSTTPLARLHSWNPKNITWAEMEEEVKLMERVECFIKQGVTLVDMMYVALSRSIQPLQARAHPMWEYTGEDDETLAIRDGFYGKKSIEGMQALLFNGKGIVLKSNEDDIGYWAHGRPSKV